MGGFNSVRQCRRWAVLAVVASVLVLPACGSSGGGNSTGNTPTTPTSTNHSPTITSISVTPSFGVSAMTVFTMNASATDPDGDALTYRWTYGGNSYTGASTSTTMTGDGGISVQLTVTDSKGATASDSRNVTMGTMTGVWNIIMPFCANGTGIQLTLNQTGGTVTGTFFLPVQFCAGTAGSTGKTDPAEPGTIDANGNVNIRLKIGAFIDFYVRGKMDTTGRRIDAGAFNSGFTGQTLTMIKQ
jgi:PKD domain-containing protein